MNRRKFHLLIAFMILLSASLITAQDDPEEVCRMLVVSDRTGVNLLYWMEEEGGELHLISSDTELQQWSPNWSPDGKRVVFTSDIDQIEQVYIMDSDGSNFSQLTNETEPGRGLNLWSPVWSPDGTEIAFSHFREETNGHDIVAMAPDGSNYRVISADPHTQLGPRWSPDGSQIAFTLYEDGSSSVYVVNAEDGSDLQNLTVGYPGAVMSGWSPDGTKIVFTQRFQENGKIVQQEIYMLDLTDNSITPLPYPDLPQRMRPLFSPDGTQIAFYAPPVDGEGDLNTFLMDPDGSNVRQITFEPRFEKVRDWKCFPLEEESTGE